MASPAVSANLKTGAALGGLCVGIYMYTMRHLKTVAPGDLDRMVPLPPSEEARRKYEASKRAAEAKAAESAAK